MATENMVKNIGEVYARLFDHRPVLQGEANFMVQRFEEQDLQASKMQQSLEQLRETSEHQIPSVKSSMDARVSQVLEKLRVAQEKCNAVLERQDNQDPEMSKWLEEQHESRARRWSVFLDEMSERSMKLNKDFDESIHQVSQYYGDLEQKLNLSPTKIV